MLPSVRTWTLCTYLDSLYIPVLSLYMPGLSSSGGQGNATLCTCLDSLLVEDKELLLSVFYLDSLVVEDREMLFHVYTLVLY